MNEVVMLLRDKVCVITGAASLRSIGYATAELFAEHGAIDCLVNSAAIVKSQPLLEIEAKGLDFRQRLFTAQRL